ncbi:MAG: hypothetical protein KAQ99_03910 [Candidatus Aureabacteria bacterium]|nr:hypothetical protein [Candidatus Auribacterota bacterium]
MDRKRNVCLKELVDLEDEEKKEITQEERQAEVAQQIEWRDIVELEKALIRINQAYTIIHKRAERFNLLEMLEYLKTQIERLLWEIYNAQKGYAVESILVKQRGILKNINLTEEELLTYWKEIGRI